MKILKRGTPPTYTSPTYKKKCPYCKSVLEYNNSDKDYLGNGCEDYFIKCPVCNHMIEVDD